MKLRSALVAAAVVGALVPSAASADNCATPIYLFTRRPVATIHEDDPRRPGRDLAVSASPPVSAVVGCTVVEETVFAGATPPEAHALTDTDIIYPGTNSMSVRFLENGRDETIIQSATVTFAGETIELIMKPGVSVTGDDAPWLDSQNIEIDQVDTLEANVAVVNICLADDGGCFTRSYRTLGTYAPEA